MIVYKKNVMKELAKKGYTCPVLRKTKFVSEPTMARLRHGGSITLKSLNNICLLLGCQPGDLIEVVPDEEEKIKFDL